MNRRNFALTIGLGDAEGTKNHAQEATGHADEALTHLEQATK